MIRAAGPHDAARIAEIHVQSWRVAYEGIFPADYLRDLSVEKRREMWRARLEDGTISTTFVAEDEAGMSGWIELGPAPDAESDGPTGEVYGFYVDPLWWRRGVGRSLWSSGLAHARSMGWTRLILWTLDANVRARGFYESMGMALDAERRTYERDGHTAPQVRYSMSVKPATP